MIDMMRLFLSDDGLRWLLTNHEVQHAVPTDWDLIDEINVPVAAIEVGKRKRNVHAHALLEIRHRTTIHLDELNRRGKRLAEHILRQLGYPITGLFVSIGLNNTQRSILYIRKGGDLVVMRPFVPQYG